jgi:hypothetical protein
MVLTYEQMGQKLNEKNQLNKLLSYTWTFSIKYVNFILLNLNWFLVNKFKFWLPEYDWNGSRFGEIEM